MWCDKASNGSYHLGKKWGHFNAGTTGEFLYPYYFPTVPAWHECSKNLMGAVAVVQGTWEIGGFPANAPSQV